MPTNPVSTEDGFPVPIGHELAPPLPIFGSWQRTAVITVAVVETRYSRHQSMSEAEDNWGGGEGWRLG